MQNDAHQGAVYLQTNDEKKNEVVAYERAADGSLTYVGAYESGGRGEVRAAFLGALVIATVSNGLNTAGYATGVIYVVTGVILLAAVTLDTVLRRRQAAAGR